MLTTVCCSTGMEKLSLKITLNNCLMTCFEVKMAPTRSLSYKLIKISGKFRVVITQDCRGRRIPDVYKRGTSKLRHG